MQSIYLNVYFTKFLICLAIICFLSMPSRSQLHVRDSIIGVLDTKLPDTERALLLAELAYLYHESKPDTALKLAMEGLDLSKKIGFKKGEAICLHRMGNAYSILGNSPRAMELTVSSMAINKKINDSTEMSRNLQNIGNHYFNQSDYQEAIRYFQTSIMFDDVKDRFNTRSLSYSGVSRSYRMLKQYDSSLIYAQQAYAVALTKKQTRPMSVALAELGNIHSALGQHTMALEYYRTSIPYGISTANNYLLCGVTRQIGTTFEKLGLTDSAYRYARLSFDMSKELGYIKGVRDASTYLSSLFRDNGNFDSAYNYLTISNDTNDSLFSDQKVKLFQVLAFDQKLDEKEEQEAAFKEKNQKLHNLQFAGIALGLVTIVILFLVYSHSIIANQKFIKTLGIVLLLLIFEFLNLLLHTPVANFTNHSPILMLVILVVLAAILAPLHHRLEHWITNKLVEKNQRIRLEAAKRTIVTIERDNVQKSNAAGK